MELSVLLACIIVTVISIHVVWVVLGKHERRDSSLPLPPPGPLRLPLIGNAFYFLVVLRQNQNPHRALARLAARFGPIVSFRPGTGRGFVVLSSPAAAREALAGSNDLALGGRPVTDCARAMAHAAGSVFFLPSSDPLWKQRRAAIGAHLSSARSLGMTRHVRDSHARQLAELVRASARHPIAVGEALYGAVANAVSNVLFSSNLVDLSSVHESSGKMFMRVVTAITEGMGRTNISDAFPFLAPLDLSGARRSTSRNMARLYAFFDQEVIESRLASGANCGDFLDAVLALHAKSQITRADICKLFTDIFAAGTETSRLTVEWAMLRLLRSPEKMEKVRAELAASLGSKEFVEESDLGKLPYLQAVVKETMRLYPTVPLLPRVVVAEGGMSLGGFGIPKGTGVLVNLWALGRDPASWPEPEEFVPERFLGDQAANFRGSDFSYIPFGAGRRVCPGMDIAARSMPLLLASILHKIDWKLPGAMTPEDVDLRERCATVLEPLTPLRAIPGVHPVKSIHPPEEPIMYHGVYLLVITIVAIFGYNNIYSYLYAGSCNDDYMFQLIN